MRGSIFTPCPRGAWVPLSAPRLRPHHGCLPVRSIRLCAVLSGGLGLPLVVVADPNPPEGLLDWFRLAIAAGGAALLATSSAVFARVRMALRVHTRALLLAAVLNALGLAVSAAYALHSVPTPGWEAAIIVLASSHAVGLVAAICLFAYFKSAVVTAAYDGSHKTP